MSDDPRMSEPRRATAYVGGSLIDATGSPPLPDAAILVRDGRIDWLGPREGLEQVDDLRVVDVAGKYVIPGLMDANVHLVAHGDPEVVLRYPPGRYDELALEAAQVTLRAGVTTVFDTWGPLETLTRVRDRIERGEAVGSRLRFAGNIVGNDGPWSADFYPGYGEALNPAVVREINAHWERSVGAELTWLPAEGVRAAVRDYIATSGVDFVKYSSSAHREMRFIAFSPDAQRAIVEEAHAAGMTAQACTMTPEALKLAIDAGVDFLQHGDITGFHPMPEALLRLIAERPLPCVALLYTERYIASLEQEPPSHYGHDWTQMTLVQDRNARRLIDAGAKLMLATDGGVFGPTVKTSPWLRMHHARPDAPFRLGSSHFFWLEAAIERGMPAQDALAAATRNIAEAYGRADELGTIECGKRADLVVLDADPLADPANYRRIALVVKDGEPVQLERLPERPVLTRDVPERSA